jgi:two-component sensor histidine kinase
MAFERPDIVSAIRRAMLARRGVLSSLAWTALAVIVPSVLRYVLDGGANGVPFVTYFPAIVLAGLFLGWRYGVLTVLGSAAAARLLFMADAPRLGESFEGVLIVGMFALTCAALLIIAHALRQALVQLTAAAEREELLNAELRHRLKNVLAVISSLVTLNRRHADPERAHEALNERIIALSRAVDLLGTDGPRACALPDLAQEALDPFLRDYDIRLSGPDCAVDRGCCMPTVLALHELATNAIKYGSLSTSGGWVDLEWSPAVEDRIAMRWREHGGPPVKPRTRSGMGTKILSMRSELSRFVLEFPPEGASCLIELKAAPSR